MSDVGKARLHFDYYHFGPCSGRKPLWTDVRQIFNVPSVHYTSHITVLLPFYTRPKRGNVRYDAGAVWTLSCSSASLPTINIESSPKQTERGADGIIIVITVTCECVKAEWCWFNYMCARIAKKYSIRWYIAVWPKGAPLVPILRKRDLCIIIQGNQRNG